MWAELWILTSFEFGELHCYEILITLVGPRLAEILKLLLVGLHRKRLVAPEV